MDKLYKLPSFAIILPINIRYLLQQLSFT